MARLNQKLALVVGASRVGNVALFVASDECFMTGQAFHVTGALTLRRNPMAAEIAASIKAAAG